ncbi:MAG: hypothetical protein HRU41_27370 [Saprospiraceae bacterium]|nr:hypothetical protein [Saprospiraceae bacterium]
MKILILSLPFILMSTLGFSQNILEALQLKSDLLGEYVEGELRSTDTIIDLKNGYYEAFLAAGGGDKTITRQAAVFRNQDGTRTLGIAITEYDFVCFHTKTLFYEIPSSKDSITAVLPAEILPRLTIGEFLSDTTVISVLQKYLPAIQENYLGADATIDKVLSEIYHIKYLLPQKGTNLVATLGVCDYIPTNVVGISPDDWSMIENNFIPIELAYDKTRKVFKRMPTGNKQH